MHKVLAIETSCDETSVSVVSNIGDSFRIHSNIIASQIEDHSKWGGVVPELAARKHLELLPFVLDEALEESKIKIEEVDYIASTVAPGLVGCLRVGSITARSLACCIQNHFWEFIIWRGIYLQFYFQKTIQINLFSLYLLVAGILN